MLSREVTARDISMGEINAGIRAGCASPKNVIRHDTKREGQPAVTRWGNVPPGSMIFVGAIPARGMALLIDKIARECRGRSQQSRDVTSVQGS